MFEDNQGSKMFLIKKKQKNIDFPLLVKSFGELIVFLNKEFFLILKIIFS